MSKSPSNQQSVKELLSKMPYVQDLSEGKLVLAICQKQSKSGCFDNQRLLIFNGKQHSVGYSNIFPKEIPIKSFDNVRFVKKSALISNTEIVKNKNNHRAIQITCKSYTYRKKQQNTKQKWVFKFKTIKAATQMMQYLKQPQKQPQHQLNNQKLIQQKKLNQSLSNKDRNSHNLPIDQNDNYYHQYPNYHEQQNNIHLLRQRQSMNNSKKESNQMKIYSFGSRQGDEERRDSQKYKTMSKGSNLSPYEMQQQMRNEVNMKLIQSRYNPQKANQNTRSKSRYDIQSNNTNTKHPQQNITPLPKLNFSSLKKYQDQQMNYVQNNKNLLKNQSRYYNINSGSLENSKNLESSKNYHHSDKVNSEQQYYQYNHNSEEQHQHPFYKQSRASSKQDNYLENKGSVKYNKANFLNYIPTSDVDENIPKQHIRSSLSRSRQRQIYSQTGSQSNYPNRNTQVDERNWNQELFFSQNPLATTISFKKASQMTVKQIIDSYTKGIADLIPVSQERGTTVYDCAGMTIIVGFSLKQNSYSTSIRKDLTELYEDNAYLASHFSSQDKIQVPLLSLIDYKGIVSLVKAKIQSSKQIRTQHIGKQIDKLEVATGIKRQELYKQKYRQTSYNHQSVIYLEIIGKLFNYSEFIPYQLVQHYINANHRSNTSIKQQHLMLFKNKKIDELVNNLEEMREIILSANDLKILLQKYGLGYQSLSFIYFRTEIKFIQDLIATQVASEEANDLIRFHIQGKIKSSNKNLLKKSKSGKNKEQLIIQSVTQLISTLCVHSGKSQEMWKVIANDINRKWGINMGHKQQSIQWGYFISALIQKLHISVDLKLLDKKPTQKIQIHMDSQFVQTFEIYSKATTPSTAATTKIIKSIQSSHIKYDNIKQLFQNEEILMNLQHKFQFPSIIKSMTKFVKINEQTQLFQQFCPYQPPSTTSIQLQVLKINEFLKQKNQSKAIEIFENACELISFWGGQFHPLLSTLYDIFTEYYYKTEQFKDAISLCKSSLVNTVKLVGNQLILAEKYKRLGEMLQQISKLNESLVNYSKARDLFAMRMGPKSESVCDMQYKIGLIQYKQSNLIDSLQTFKKALKIMMNLQNPNEQILMHIFSLINSIYQQQSQFEEMKQNSISCFETLSKVQDINKYSEVLRISILPFLIELDLQRKQSLKHVLKNIVFEYSPQQYMKYLISQIQPQNVLEQVVSILNRISLIQQNLNHRDKSHRKSASRGKYQIEKNQKSYSKSKYSTPSKQNYSSPSRHNTIDKDILKNLSILEAVAGIVQIQYITQKLQQYTN